MPDVKKLVEHFTSLTQGVALKPGQYKITAKTWDVKACVCIPGVTFAFEDVANSLSRSPDVSLFRVHRGGRHRGRAAGVIVDRKRREGGPNVLAEAAPGGTCCGAA